VSQREHLDSYVKIADAIDSPATKEGIVARKRNRHQEGHVFLNKPKTMWLLAYSDYSLGPDDRERRQRKQAAICPSSDEDGLTVTKKEAKRRARSIMYRVKCFNFLIRSQKHNL
jgi:hypothetical protein